MQLLKPVIVILLIITFIFIGAVGYRMFSSPKDPPSTVIIKEVEKPEAPKKPAVENPPAQNADEAGKTEQPAAQLPSKPVPKKT